jgi:hypothetical protein
VRTGHPAREDGVLRVTAHEPERRRVCRSGRVDACRCRPPSSRNLRVLPCDPSTQGCIGVSAGIRRAAWRYTRSSSVGGRRPSPSEAGRNTWVWGRPSGDWSLLLPCGSKRPCAVTPARRSLVVPSDSRVHAGRDPCLSPVALVRRASRSARGDARILSVEPCESGGCLRGGGRPCSPERRRRGSGECPRVCDGGGGWRRAAGVGVRAVGRGLALSRSDRSCLGAGGVGGGGSRAAGCGSRAGRLG